MLSANSTGIFIDGAEPVGGTDLTVSSIDFQSQHIFRVEMAYTGSTLTVTITDTVTLASAQQQYTVDIPARVGSDAFVGFTGATGADTCSSRVTGWTFGP